MSKPVCTIGKLIALASLSVYLPISQAAPEKSTQAITPKAAATQANDTKTAQKAPANDAFILVQSATSGSIERDNTQKDTYKITLHNVMPYLSYVADRPNRTVGKISIEKYLKLWIPKEGNSFQNNPPNAIVHAISSASAADGQTQPPIYYAVEISQPVYDKAAGTLTYQAKAMVGEKDSASIPEAANYNHMTLIIDDVCFGCYK